MSYDILELSQGRANYCKGFLAISWTAFLRRSKLDLSSLRYASLEAPISDNM